MKDSISFKYRINENLIHNKSNIQVIVDHYEVHMYDGKLYIIYCCSSCEYGFQIKGHAIDFRKED